MINHARTLLMNADAAGYVYNGLGEEYIPAGFTAVDLPGPILTGRRILFGAQPDRLYLNYRLRQLMAMLHTTELAEYVTALDPRVTYWPITNRELFDPTFGVSARLVAGNPVSPTTPMIQLYVRGEPQPDHRLGKLAQNWFVKVTDTNTVSIHYTWPNMTQFSALNITHGLSAPISLGSGMFLRIGQAPRAGIPSWTTMTTPDWEYLTDEGWQLLTPDAEANELVGTTWEVRANARPSLDIYELVRKLQQGMGAPNLVRLFGSPPTGLYKMFYDLWTEHPQLPYKLGGFLLAMIYRTNELRRE